MAAAFILSFSTAGILDALVSAANDKEDDAQRAVFKAIVDIARKKHKLVLSTCHAFLVKHTKVHHVPAPPQKCI